MADRPSVQLAVQGGPWITSQEKGTGDIGATWPNIGKTRPTVLPDGQT